MKIRFVYVKTTYELKFDENQEFTELEERDGEFSIIQDEPSQSIKFLKGTSELVDENSDFTELKEKIVKFFDIHDEQTEFFYAQSGDKTMINDQTDFLKILKQFKSKPSRIIFVKKIDNVYENEFVAITDKQSKSGSQDIVNLYENKSFVITDNQSKSDSQDIRNKSII